MAERGATGGGLVDGAVVEEEHDRAGRLAEAEGGGGGGRGNRRSVRPAIEVRSTLSVGGTHCV